jgi:hypothetical protein
MNATSTTTPATVLLLAMFLTLTAGVVAQSPKPVPKPFDELSVTLKTSAFGAELPATITVTPDGKCVYDVGGRPGVNTIPAWPAAKVTHTLPPERLQLLTELLKATDWLGKEPAKGPPQLHSTDYTLNLKRDGKPSTAVCRGEQAPYTELTTFFAHLSTQEYLLYRLETVPDRDSSAGARHTLDSYLRAELGEPFASKPTFALDYTRFTTWATGLVRKPDGKSADDLSTAVRLVAHLRLESERKQLTKLTEHESTYVRRAAGDALDWMSPEAVKLAKTLAEYCTKMPPAEGLAEQEGRTLRGMDYNQNHLRGVATRLKATTRGEALILFAHLRAEPNANLRFIAAVGLNGIYKKYPSGFSAEAFTDLQSPAHRTMIVTFQAALDASGK